MTRLRELSRGALRFTSRAGTVVAGVMLVVSVVSAVAPRSALALPAGAAPTSGQLMQANNNTSGITNGLHSTPFALSYTGDNSCAGDSATDGYRVNSFMVPASVDVSQLAYNAAGPIAPTGVTFAFPLFAAAGNAQQVNRNTAPTTGIITAGNLLQPLSFAALAAGGIAVPNGEYKVGLACTLLGVTEEFWQSTITVSASTTGPVAFEWAVTDSPTTTTTTTTAASTTTAATTTTVVGGTTTTVGGGTTTTLAGGSTTSTSSTTSTTIKVSSGGSTGSSGTTGSSSIPVTGSSSVPIAVWAILLLVFGRMTILFARPVRVLPPEGR